MKKNILFILVAIIIVGGIWYFVSNRPANEGSTLTVIHQGSWFGDAPLYVAQEKGFFEKYGVKVDIQKVEEAQARRQLLSSGRADVSAETIDMSVLDINAGVDKKMFMALDTSLGADGVVAKQEIQKASDLIGKTIGVSKGDTPYFLLLYYLRQQGIDTDSVNFQEMPNVDTAATTFLSGQVDAAGTWEPWLSRAGERSGGHVLVSSKEVPGVIVDVAVAGPGVLENKQQELIGFAKAWFDAIEFWRTNPEEAVAIMAKEYNLSADEFNELITQIRWDDRASNLTYFGDNNNKGQGFSVAQTIIDIAREEGIVTKDLQADSIIDLRILDSLK